MSIPYIVLFLLIVSGFLFGFKKWRKLRITLTATGFVCIAASFVALSLLRDNMSLIGSRDAFLYMLIGTVFILVGLWVKKNREVKV